MNQYAINIDGRCLDWIFKSQNLEQNEISLLCETKFSLPMLLPEVGIDATILDIVMLKVSTDFSQKEIKFTNRSHIRSIVQSCAL